MNRRFWVAVSLLAAWLSIVLLPGAPAQAHGAMSNPVSRTMECGAEGGSAANSAACTAARAVTGTIGAFDNLRLPNVDGNDRQAVPDGKLCSAGIPEYAGLDLPRADWPTTTLTTGARTTFRYRVTIPHDGSFRLYLTRAGYRPTQPLRWADLETKAFLTVANPPIRDGSYTFSGTLPAGRTGRAVLYTIWQTTSTVDTYYSCSDVVLTSHPTAAAPSTVATAPEVSALPVANRQAGQTSYLLPVAAVGVGVVVVLAAAVLFLLTRRRSQPGSRQR
ncbi:MAG: lytic polysaccharide monooxygenase [Micromonosporaceae bacterium]|nr:lytic polysaccharide monooxygenase [Micromonosporaceae bacterium]